MAWERRGKHRYYYRVSKRSGRVVRKYFGSGQRAEEAAMADANRRTAHRACRQFQSAKRCFLKRVDAAVTAGIAPIDLLFRATLIGAGYWQHERGEWRRRRNVSIN